LTVVPVDAVTHSPHDVIVCADDSMVNSPTAATTIVTKIASGVRVSFVCTRSNMAVVRPGRFVAGMLVEFLVFMII
jgi:hypothetical protein